FCFKGLNCLSSDKKLNLGGKKLRVASLKSLPFQNVKKINDSYFIGEGFSFEIVKQLSQHFNFKYDVVVPEDQDYGMMINGTSWTGLVGMLVNNEADMAASPLSITQERLKAVTFSSNLYKDSLGLMFRTPEGQQNTDALLEPFTNTSLLPPSKISAQVKDRLTFSDCIWFVFSSLMKQGFCKTTEFNSVRMLMATWWLSCFLLASFYTANLTAFMTTETPFTDRTIEQFILSGRKWTFKKGTAFSDYLFKENVTINKNEFSLLKKSFADGDGMMINSDEQALDYVHKGYAYIQEVNVISNVLFKDFMNMNGYCQFSSLDLRFFEHATAFAFSKDSPYASSFSK
ncbi:glutamate receptor 2, partial [Caerostris darwini]